MVNHQTTLMKSIMRNPESSKLFRDAINSPVGSTVRERAKRHYSIMSRLQTSRDGSGGPGMAYDQMAYGQNPAPEMDPVHIPTDESKGLIVFHKIPTPKITYGNAASKYKPRAGSFDGSGGPGTIDGEGGIGDWLTGALGAFGNAIGGFSGPAIATNPISSSLYGSVPTAPVSGWAPPTSGLSALGTNSYTPSAYNINPVAPPKPGTSPWLTGGPIGASVPEPIKASYPSLSSIASIPGSAPVGTGSMGSIDNQGNFVGGMKTAAGGAFNPLNPATFTFNKPTIPYATIPSSVAAAISQKPSIDMSGPAAYQAANPDTATTASSTQDGTTNAPSFYSNLNGVTSTQNTQTSTGGTTSGLSNVGSAGSSLGQFTANLVATERDPNQGEWTQVGPAIASGANAGYRALGKYQIMPNLHFASIGLDPNNPADVQKFLNTPALQDQLYNKIISDLSNQYGGDPVKVAAAYFGGDKAAQIVGTTAGDDPASGDGHMSINQYVSSVLNKNASLTVDTSNPSNAAPGTGAYGVTDSVNKAEGGTMFARNTMMDKDNPVTGGKTLAQVEAENKTSIWSSYNIDTLKQEQLDEKNAGLALPMTMTNYIRDQDQYLNQTDQMINDYIAQNVGKARSNEENQAYASHLNYLYTLRGAQNQKYIDQIGSAVAMNKIDLQRTTDQLTLNLQSATDALTSANAMSKDTYDTYTKALTDMYDAVDKNPAKLLQNQYLEAQILSKSGTTAADAIKNNAQVDLVNAAPYLKAYSVWDNNNFAIPGTDIIKTAALLQQDNSAITPQVVYTAYTQGLFNYLAAPDEKSGTTGTGVTSAGKQQLITEAINSFVYLRAASSPDSNGNGGDPTTYASSNALLKDISSKLAGTTGASLVNSGVVPQLQEAVRQLTPTTFWGGAKAAPTEQEFVDRVNSKTQNQVPEGISRAIYATFKAYVASGGSPESFVLGTLTNKTTTGGTTYTPSEFGQVIGGFYGDDMINKAIAALKTTPGSTMQQ